MVVVLAVVIITTVSVKITVTMMTTYQQLKLPPILTSANPKVAKTY